MVKFLLLMALYALAGLLLAPLALLALGHWQYVLAVLATGVVLGLAGRAMPAQP